MLTRQWMYNRNLPGRKGLTNEFVVGVDEFIQFAINQDDSYKNGENIRCPCFKCKNRRFLHPDDVISHLYRRGFKECYWNWTCHGEELFKSNEEHNEVHDQTTDQMADQGDYEQMTWDQRMVYDCLRSRAPLMDPSHSNDEAGPSVQPPFNDSVVIDYKVKRAIHELVQGHYKEPWFGWGKVPKDVRQRMFTAFRGIYTWESHHESLILGHFNHEASEWLKKHLYLARTVYKAPLEWMTPSVWESLQKYWESEEFKKISEQNKKNRAINGSSTTVIYRGGSVSTAVHRLRLIEELGREPTPKECFIRTHGKNDGTLEGERATQIVEQFDKALADKRNQGEDENSINQNELWDRIAIGSRNKVLGKGNIVRQISSNNYKPRSGPSESSGQLHNKIKELETELARTRVEQNAMRAEHEAMRIEYDAMQAEWARRDSFETSLLTALRLKGIDLSDMHVATLTRPVPRAPTAEAQSHVDEHSPTPKRHRTTLAADSSPEDLNYEDDIC